MDCLPTAIAFCADRHLSDPPHPTPRCSPEAIPEFAYRKVRIRGHFDHAHEIQLGPKTREGELGYHVIVPFVRGDGSDTILVNRGFIKRAKRDQKTRPESLVRSDCFCACSQRWSLEQG